MSAILDGVALWLADFHLVATALLLGVLAALVVVKQPARRMAVVKATLGALAGLVLLCALPGWSVIHLMTDAAPQVKPLRFDRSLVVPEERSATQLIPTVNVDRMSPERPGTVNVAPLQAVEPQNLSRWVDWLPLAASVHLIGSAAVLVWLIGGAILAGRIYRGATAAPVQMQRLLARVVGSASAPELLVSAEVATPVALGVRRPAIILPRSSDLLVPSPLRGGLGRGATAGTSFDPLPNPPLKGEGAGEDLIAILAHEWAHIRNGDLRTLAVSRLMLVLLWPQPLYWWLRRHLRLDQEALADAAAADVAGRVEYAERLVGWARLQDRGHKAPRLAGAVGLWEGPSQLKRRIALLLDEKFAVMRSCSRRWRGASFTAMTLAAVGLSLVTLQPASRAEDQEASGENESASAKSTVTLDKLISGLKSREDALETLRASYRCRNEFRFVKPGEERPAEFIIEDDAVSMIREAEVRWEVTREGRGRMEADINKVNVTADGAKVPKKEEILSSYDGNSGQWLETIKAADGTVLRRVGRSTGKFQRTHSSPFDFATQHLGSPISELLTKGDAAIIETQRWERRPVVVVEVSPVTVREDYIYRQRFWIDADRKTAVRRQSFVQRGEGKPWGLHYQVDAKQYSEVSPGVWLPAVVDILNYHVTEDGQDFLTGKDHCEVSEWKVNETIESSRFNLEYPEDTLDIDHLKPGQPVPTRSPIEQGEEKVDMKGDGHTHSSQPHTKDWASKTAFDSPAKWVLIRSAAANADAGSVTLGTELAELDVAAPLGLGVFNPNSTAEFAPEGESRDGLFSFESTPVE